MCLLVTVQENKTISDDIVLANKEYLLSSKKMAFFLSDGAFSDIAGFIEFILKETRPHRRAQTFANPTSMYSQQIDRK